MDKRHVLPLCFFNLLKDSLSLPFVGSLSLDKVSEDSAMDILQVVPQGSSTTFLDLVGGRAVLAPGLFFTGRARASTTATATGTLASSDDSAVKVIPDLGHGGVGVGVGVGVGESFEMNLKRKQKEISNLTIGIWN